MHQMIQHSPSQRITNIPKYLIILLRWRVIYNHNKYGCRTKRPRGKFHFHPFSFSNIFPCICNVKRRYHGNILTRAGGSMYLFLKFYKFMAYEHLRERESSPKFRFVVVMENSNPVTIILFRLLPS